jgi:hypothetical protein
MLPQEAADGAILALAQCRCQANNRRDGATTYPEVG